MSKSRAKYFLMLCLSVVPVYGLSMVQPACASRLKAAQINTEDLEEVSIEEVDAARKAMVKRFEERGHSFLAKYEILNDINKVISNKVEEYKKLIDEEIQNSNLNEFHAGRVKQKVGDGSQAKEFLKLWKTESERKRKDAKQLFISNYSNLYAYRKYLSLMYDTIIEPVADLLDSLYENIELIESKHQEAQKYALELDRAFSKKAKEAAEAELAKKMVSMDFTQYDRIDDFVEGDKKPEQKNQNKKVKNKIRKVNKDFPTLGDDLALSKSLKPKPSDFSDMEDGDIPIDL